MNFYFCETCGKRITDIDLQQGDGRNKKMKGVYCKSCAVGVLTMDLPAISDSEAREYVAELEASKPRSAVATPPRQNPRVPTSRVVSARRDPTAPLAPPSNNGKQMLAGGIAASVVLLGVVTWMLTRPHSDSSNLSHQSETKPAPPALPHATAIENADRIADAPSPTPKAEISKPVQTQQNPEAHPVSAFDNNIGEDIREAVARKKLSDIAEQERSGKLTSAEIYAQYSDLATSSYRSTKAGMEAAAKLKTLPPPAQPKPTLEQPTATAPAVENAVSGKKVWWEGEDALETDFVAHIWLSEQGLDKQKISGGRYLNHLNDPTWLKTKGKAPAKALFARYVVDVPADATYSLWVREYDTYSAGPWKFRWDDGKWFDVPPGQPYVDKVEIGKDRWLVWRQYPGQVLTKGKHSFRLEVNLEKNGISAFDCFLLTVDAFKPDGPRKP
jgi:hypothetical protein